MMSFPNTRADITAGATNGYRPNATFTLGTELRRQASRRRTQVTIGLLAALPLMLLAAFAIGGEGSDADEGMARLATVSGVNFALFTIFVSASFLLVVVVALFFGDTVASEASSGSLRYLLAIPVPRARFLMIKVFASALYTATALALLAIVAVLAGALAYGWGPLQLPVGSDLPVGAAVLRIMGALGYIGIALLGTAGLAFLLSVSTDAPLGAVGGAVVTTIVSSILEQVRALGTLRDLLPTRYGFAWMDWFSDPIQVEDMLKGAISAFIYASIFFSLAWWRFLRKDIVS